MEIARCEYYREHRIEIHWDENPRDPREDDNLGVIGLFHMRVIRVDEYHSFESPEELLAYIKKEKYFYQNFDHHNTGTGIIFVDREKIKREYSVKRITKKIKERVYRLLEAEVREYDSYLSGYRIIDKDGNDVDSCWGFFEIDEAMREAKVDIDSLLGQDNGSKKTRHITKITRK
jgi:hypothetical protein